MNSRKSGLMIVVIGLLVFAGVWYYNTTVSLEDSTVKTVAEVIEEVKQPELRDLDNKIIKLQDYYSNSDIKGIISIEGLNDFSYPVVQTTDNNYYLNHNYYKAEDAYGAIYADYRVNLDSSKKILIFGHSSTKRDVPFNELENYYNSSYYDKHKYINVETETNTYRYEIFSVYVETSDFTYMNMNFISDKDWFLHILELQEKSLYQIDVDLDSDDDILILQTCSNNSKYSEYSKKYLLIVSRRVK